MSLYILLAQSISEPGSIPSVGLLARVELAYSDLRVFTSGLLHVS